MEDNDLILIDKFLDGTLSIAEKALFENRLRDDPKFKNRLQLIQEVASAQSLETEEFKKSLKDISKKYENSNSQFDLKKIWPLILGILLLSFLAFYFLKPKPIKETTKHLYAAYFSTYPNVITTRNNESSNALEIPLAQYDNGNFIDANTLFEKLRSENFSDTLYFYYGVSLMQTDQEQKAINLFKEITKDKNSAFNAQANWYQALAHVKANEIDAAKDVLERLLKNNSSSTYSTKAKKLLTKL